MKFVECQVCHVIKRELFRHLRLHNLTVADYRVLFPDAPIMTPRPSVSDATRKKISQASKKMHDRQREQDGERWLARQQERAAKARAAKGRHYKHSDATLAKMRGPRPSIQGVPKTEEHKRKLSIARTGRQFGPHSPETIEKMRQAWVRRKTDHETYARYIKKLSDRSSNPIYIKALRERVACLIKDGRHNGKSSNTKPELMMKKYLDENCIAYEQQHILHTDIGAWTFDFFIPSLNMFVEVDSYYYHTKSLEVWNRDVTKERYATDRGYVVARISDRAWDPSIIHADPDKIRAMSDDLKELHHAAIIQRLGALQVHHQS